MQTRIPSTQAPAPSQWEVFSAAPHRMVFLAGAAQVVLVMILWLAELLGRIGLLPLLPLVVPAT